MMFSVRSIIVFSFFFFLTGCNLTVENSGGGTVTSSDALIACGETCVASYGNTSNTPITLEAVPDEGYVFDGWGNDCLDKDPCVLSLGAVSGDKLVTASFSAFDITLTVENGGGGVVTSGDNAINCGDACQAKYSSDKETSVLLSATEESGYSFVGWGGDCSGQEECSLSLGLSSGDKSVTATFEQVLRTLSVSHQGGGVVTSSDGKINCAPACSANYDTITDQSITLTAVPSEGYNFDGWSGGCTDLGPCIVTIGASTQDVNVTAAFSQLEPQLVKVTLHNLPGDDVDILYAMSVDGLGDVNSDGYDDFVVGRKGHYVKVYSGFDASVIHDLKDNVRYLFGENVRSVGDIDGDTINDFAVSDAISRTVYVYSGANGSQLYMWTGGSYYGDALAAAGDVNKDGVPDVIIGAPRVDKVDEFGTVLQAGAAEVRSGADGSILYSYEGFSERGYLGSAVTGLGDINSDGYDDFAMRVYRASFGGRTIVRIYSGKTGEIYRSIDVNYGTTFGTTLVNLGDVDKDGINDLGISNTESGTAKDGYVAVYSGKTAKFIGSKSGTAWSRAGYGIANVRDANGDGSNDFLMSLSATGTGKAWLVSGIDRSVIYEFPGQSGDKGFGYGVAYAGDVNGDGKDDYVIGASSTGRVEVVTLLLDSDGDSVADVSDAFPLDKSKT